MLGGHRQGCLPCPPPSCTVGKAIVGALVASVLEVPPWRRPPSCLPASPAQPPGLPAPPRGVNQVHVPLCAEGPCPPCSIHLSGLSCLSRLPHGQAQSRGLSAHLQSKLPVRGGDRTSMGWCILEHRVPSRPVAIRGHVQAQDA